MTLKRSAFVVGLGITGFVLSAGFQGTLDPIKVRHVLDQPGMPTIKVVGVCDITADSIKCWDVEGKNFESLSERIWAYYLSQSHANLYIRPGSKNRWVAIERPNSGQEEWSWSGIESTGGGNSTSANNWREGTTLEWIRMDFLKEDREGGFKARFYKSLPGVQLALAKGKSVVIDGQTLTFRSMGNAPKDPNANRMNFGFPMNYQVVLDRKFSGELTGPAVYPSLVGKDGRPIQYVDSKGKPTMPNATMGFMSGMMNAQISQRGISEKDVTYSTNVNPKYIGSMVFSRNQSRLVEFSGIPLDPK